MNKNKSAAKKAPRSKIYYSRNDFYDLLNQFNSNIIFISEIGC